MKDLEMSFRSELCVYQQKKFMRIIHSFFIAHLNYLQAFLLSCPSTAILGEPSKLQVQFGFCCSRKHHPHKCWEMSGAVLTNSFAGALPQTEHLPECRWHPFPCFPGERGCISRVCYHIDLEGTAALKTVFWGFIHLQQVSPSSLKWEICRGNIIKNK